jgi:hypothetical protein
MGLCGGSYLGVLGGDCCHEWMLMCHLKVMMNGWGLIGIETGWFRHDLIILDFEGDFEGDFVAAGGNFWVFRNFFILFFPVLKNNCFALGLR